MRMPGAFFGSNPEIHWGQSSKQKSSTKQWLLKQALPKQRVDQTLAKIVALLPVTTARNSRLWIQPMFVQHPSHHERKRPARQRG